MKKAIFYIPIILFIFLSCQKEEEKEEKIIITPPHIEASKGLYTNKIELNWSKISNASSYLIFRYDSLNSTYAEITETDRNTYVDSEIFETMYRFYYKVKAKSESSTSGFSNFDFGYLRLPYEPTLEQPNNFTTSKGEFVDKIVLNWEAHPTINNFQIYKYDEDSGTDELIGETTNNFFNDISSHIPFKEYTYKVRSYHSENEFSEFTNIAIGFVDEFKFNNSLEVIDGDTTNYIHIQWDNIKGADKYEVFRSLNPENGFDLLGLTTENYYNDEDNEKYITYFYKTRAINNLVGESNHSNIDSGLRLEVYQHIFTIEDPNLNSPYGVTYCNGYIYITSSSASPYGNIIKMNTETNVFEIICELSSPRGIEIDIDQNLKVGVSSEHKVLTFTKDGELLDSWGEGLWTFREIDIDQHGDVFLADITNNQVRRYDADGNLLFSWNSYNGVLLEKPQAIECTNDHVVVIDKNSICFFTKEGEYLKNWEIFENYLSYVIEYHKGFYYITRGNHILKLNPEGEVVAKIGLGNINTVAGIAFDEQDNIYFVGHVSDLIYKYAPPLM